MKERLADYLICPVCHGSLDLTVSKREGKEIVTGRFSCQNGHDYPISDGVPRMIPFIEDEGKKQTQESFSDKWEQIPDFGFDDGSQQVYVNWYLERYGFGTVEKLREFLKDKSKVLDAGTGLGRDAHLYASNCPGEVFALDLSTSINHAYKRLKDMTNLHLLQADLTALPFPDDMFDYLACDQVIHHTPDTATSFAHLAKHVAPGGQFATYVYKKKGPIREFSDDFLRDYYTKSSPEECYEFSKAMTALGRSLTDLNVEIDIPEDIPILQIKAGKHDLQRWLYWNIFKIYWNDTLDEETNIMTNYDWYRPEHAHRHTAEELQDWCDKAGLKVLRMDIIESGISCRSERPKEE